MKNKIIYLLATLFAAAILFVSCDKASEPETPPTPETPENPVISVSSVSLDLNTLDLKSGETYTLKATILPDNATNKTVTWSSNNSAVASVDATGKVTAVSEGEALITAKAGDKSAVCAVTIKRPDFSGDNPEEFENEEEEW